MNLMKVDGRTRIAEMPEVRAEMEVAKASVL